MSDWSDEMQAGIAGSKKRYDERIAKLQTKQTQQKKRDQLETNRLLSRYEKAEKYERNRETRRLIIEGRLWRRLREERPELEELFAERLEGYLEEKDRELFGFDESSGVEQA